MRRASRSASRRNDAASAIGSRTGGNGPRIVSTRRCASGRYCLIRSRHGRPAPGWRRVQRCDRRLKIAMQCNRGPILERVSHDRARADPANTLRLEIELAHGRRRDCHGIESGAVIVDESRERRLHAGGGAAGRGSVFDHRHRQARPSEMNRAHQARTAGAHDHHSAVRRHGASRMQRLRRTATAPAQITRQSVPLIRFMSSTRLPRYRSRYPRSHQTVVVAAHISI